MSMSVVGVDIAKASFDVALPLVTPGKYKTRAKLPNSPEGFTQFRDWLLQHAPEAAVCMEATSVYHDALATFLHQQEVTVFVVNPAQIHAYGKSELSRTKSDRTDAKLIARFAMAQAHAARPLLPWQPPTPAQRKLRALAHRLDDLERMRQMESNRLGTADAAVISSIQQLITTLQQQIDDLRRDIDNHIDSDPDLRRDRDLLQSIPGIGPVLSTYLLACAGGLRAYRDPDKLAAYVGLNPAVRESGKWKGKTTISKLGHALLRAKLYWPAVTASRHNPPIKRLVDRLVARGKPRMLAITAAMRKLLHIAWGVVRSGKPSDPNIALA